MTELLGIAQFKFHEGKREEYLRLSDQAMEIVRTKDSGTLGYDLYLNGDRVRMHGHRRYRDSEPAIDHPTRISETCPQRSLRRSPWFTANCSLSRAQRSERSWLAAKCPFSSLPTGHGVHDFAAPSVEPQVPERDQLCFTMTLSRSAGRHET